MESPPPFGSRGASFRPGGSAPDKEAHEAPWLDLLDPLTELILERLPLPDYLRFGAVCRKWRSIQRAHRIRHSPGPPPMPHPLPWLLSWRRPYTGNIDPSLLHCYSPFGRSLHRLPLPVPLPFTDFSHHCLASAHGWLLLIHVEDLSLSLLNPITAAQIHLPPVFPSLSHEFDFIGAGAMSAPPTHPDCVLLLLDADHIFLLKLNNRGPHAWTQLPLHHPSEAANKILGPCVVFSGDTFYCICIAGWLYAVDPRPLTPTVRFLDMDCSQLPLEGRAHDVLAELGGEVLLVVALLSDEPPFHVMEFQVFRADISGEVWVRVHTLGDRSLFPHEGCSFSLLAADVGCKKNCIYCPTALTRFESHLAVLGKLVQVFDFETGRSTCEYPETELDLSKFGRRHGIWLMPRLDHVNPG